ncbi:hypothetical protein [Endozoicomonas euniceicola]|uniref:RNA polymerase sigma-70 region 4 domain-containing protein n=1 Tax=Endozoicomonas euniceicola TaxID=1234143 RepID=A0ABY6GPB9_9GAMM|nr:hypothetical protein [Endozoicomonas euniceicola]UYM14587.1 hypothetical protein NX720_17040 [Endozoicomonas euniceicola]
MSRTIDALKLIVEELDEHSCRLNNVEVKQNTSKKIIDHQARDIESLRVKIRDLEIREKARTGIRKKVLAEEYGLSPGRITQITNSH